MDLTLFKENLNGGLQNTEKNQRLLDIIDGKKAMLQAPEVAVKLSPTEFAIAQAGTLTPIRLTSEEDLIGQVAKAARGICKDVGIREREDPDKMKYNSTRFFTILKKHYSEFSINEVKAAFELASVGALDDYLPKDRDGNPDKNHYQAFNVEYYSKILNAYRKKRGDVWGKVRQALPVTVAVISEEEKKRNRQLIVNEIYDAYIDYQKGKHPRFEVAVYIKVLIEEGHVKDIPKPLKKDIDKAYKNLFNSEMDRKEKKIVINNYHNNIREGLLLSEGQRVANNRVIASVFDVWMKRGFDLINTEG